MPVFVDHEERRNQVAEVAGELVAKGGAEALTLRKVAQAIGCSTTVVSHYFADKRDLLLATYRAAAERSRIDVHAAMAQDDLQKMLEAWVPMTPQRHQNSRIWFAFWDAAIADPELVIEQRGKVRAARDTVCTMLLRTTLNGRKPTPAEAERIARHTMTVVMGIALQASFDAEDWPADKQREAIRDHLRAIGWKATRVAA
jgi:AcrR family transcriptional regulator